MLLVRLSVLFIFEQIFASKATKHNAILFIVCNIAVSTFNHSNFLLHD